MIQNNTNKIEEITSYLLNPHKAIKDNYSFFESLHEILKIKKNNDSAYTDREVYDIYWAVVSYLYEGGEKCQFAKDLRDMNIVFLGVYGVTDYLYRKEADVHTVWLNIKTMPTYMYYNTPANLNTLFDEIKDMYWGFGFKFKESVTYSIYVDRFTEKKTSNYTDQEIIEIHDKLVERGYMNPNIKTFTALCYNEEIADTNRIEWIKKAERIRKINLTALKVLIVLLFGLDDTAKTDGRRRIKQIATDYFGETFTASTFQNKTKCEEELESIVKSSTQSKHPINQGE